MNAENHHIEHAATGSTVEQADARGRAGDAALRFAPPWVVERIAKIREERGLDREVENRAVVEHASETRETAAVTRSLAHAPAHIVRSVNVARRRRGLPEIAARRPEPTGGPGVWVVDKRTGRLVPATAARTIGTTSRPPARATPRATPGRVVERVLILPCPSFSDAPSRNLGTTLPETVSPTAFGTAAALNADQNIDLRLGHRGPRLAIVGGGLRFHGTQHGIIAEWIIDPKAPMAAEARQALRRGAASVAMLEMQTRTYRLPWPTTCIVAARLHHVALMPDGERPAYEASVAMRFEGSRLGDDRELREQIDAVIREARFRARKARS
jgi:hypothetical protein